MNLVPCPRCQRHVKASETRCPFCGLVPKGASFAAALALTAGLALMGCPDKQPPAPEPVAKYGAPPVAKPTPPPTAPAPVTPDPGDMPVPKYGAPPAIAEYGAPPLRPRPSSPDDLAPPSSPSRGEEKK